MDWMSLRVCAGALAPLVAASLLSTILPVRAAEPGQQPQVRVARLIRDLGASEFSKRQAANDELAKLGQATRGQLEAALEDPDVEVRLRARQLLDRLKLDELWNASIVHYQAKSEAASKILLALAAQSGNHIHIGEPYGHLVDLVLDVGYDGVAYWEAVDDICSRSANRIRPHYDMHTPGIVISSGAPPKYPRAYSGPLRAQITGARRVFIEEVNYEEHKTELTHSFQINLQFSWEDRFGVVGYANQPELIEAVTDNAIIVSAAQPSAGGWSATTRGMRQVTASLKLNPVSVTARSFDVFKIRWGLIAVGPRSTLEISDLEPNKLHAQDDLHVKLDSIETQPGAKFTVSLTVARDLAMPEPQEVIFQEYDVELLDGQGRPMRVQSQQQSLNERGVQLRLTFGGESPQSEPKTLKLHYPCLRARRYLELVFRDVPLPVGKPE